MLALRALRVVQAMARKSSLLLVIAWHCGEVSDSDDWLPQTLCTLTPKVHRTGLCQKEPPEREATAWGLRAPALGQQAGWLLAGFAFLITW